MSIWRWMCEGVVRARLGVGDEMSGEERMIGVSGCRGRGLFAPE